MPDGSSARGFAIAVHYIRTSGKAPQPTWPRAMLSRSTDRRVVARKTRPERADRQVRYALIVSLRAPVQVDLYTPIETEVGIPVGVLV